MIKRIFYPTDFSPHAHKCIDYILHIQECGVEEVVLLHVMDQRLINYASISSDGILDEELFTQDCKRNSKSQLRKIAKPFKAAGLKTRTLIRLGEPFAEIIRTAEEVDASLVVLGHRGHSKAEELLLGSTAEKVVRKCKRPVLLIR